MSVDAAAIADAALDMVHAGERGADAEVCVDRASLAVTRFANSVIHQNVSDETVTVRIRIHTGGRTAAGSTSLTDPAALRQVVARTLDAARVAPLDPGWPGVAPPATVMDATAPDDATAEATADDRATIVRTFVDAAGGLETAGYCRTSSRQGAFANSAGQRASETTATAAFDGIARHNGADGVARLASLRIGDLGGATLGARAAAKARSAGGADEWPPGHYEVVLEPAAVVDLLSNLAAYGFGGRPVNEGRSFVEVGATQFDPAVTLVDDSPAIGQRYDVEGTPRHRLVLVDEGTTVAVVHDRRTAAEVGTESTGHALGVSAFGPLPVNLELLAAPSPSGGATEVEGPVADSSVAALVGQVTKGVLVSDLWYTRVLDPRTLVVTGLTRNGVWAIEDGEVTRPLTNFRFTQSYAEAMAPGAVLAIGTNPVAQPDSWLSAQWTAPAVHLREWNFTGGASG
jgi:predicted Zn-dependent protease